MKTLVYDTPVDNDLVARIAVAAGQIRDMHGVFQNFWISMLWRCEVHILDGGRNFEHFFDPCTFCFFTCIIKTIFPLWSFFFMMLLCTSLLQEIISDPALLHDFVSSGCTLSLLGILKRFTETPCIICINRNAC